MRTVLNIIWVVLGGWFTALGWLVAALFSVVLIVTIPAAPVCLRMASYSFWPFGRTVVDDPHASAVGSGLFNLVWVVFIGWWLALLHIFGALGQALSIVGLINAVAMLKMVPLAFMPYGKRIIDVDSPTGYEF
ncbi:YccF domain-containing protein [Stomatohabitans albus]|uniref:YccF domain-containing protein n=1 Tax=Stomatohabitans albus TaxID=3110766 RepID=UPI00300D30E7